MAKVTVTPREVGERWCQRIAGLFSEYIDGELDAQADAAVAAHLGRCPACGRAACDLARVVAGLHRLRTGRAWPAVCRI
jgi:anti-sigma factor RsiW